MRIKFISRIQKRIYLDKIFIQVSNIMHAQSVFFICFSFFHSKIVSDKQRMTTPLFDHIHQYKIYTIQKKHTRQNNRNNTNQIHISFSFSIYVHITRMRQMRVEVKLCSKEEEKQERTNQTCQHQIYRFTGVLLCHSSILFSLVFFSSLNICTRI